MKNSGIEWFGALPEQWKISSIGALYTARNEKVSDTEYPPLSVTMKGVVPQLETAAKTDAHDDRKLIKKGDFAINSRSDRRGSCGISEYDGSVSLINTILTPRAEMNPHYYNWLFHTAEFADEFYKWGHGIVDDLWTTRWQEMKNISLPIPSLAEQEKISGLLAEKVSKIDALILNQERQIEKLKQYKQSLITEVVTKGLDPSAPLKDSGIEWIGKIAISFTLKRLKDLVYIMDNCRQPITADQRSQDSDVLYDYYGASGVIDKIDGFTIDDHVMLIGEDGANLRLRNLPLMYEVNGRAWINNHAHILKPKENNSFDYLFFALEGLDLNPYITGSAQPKLSQENLKNIWIPVPNYEIQEQIGRYIRNKHKKVDKLIAIKQSKIEKLNQYKKSLIYEYVTGKREVNDDEKHS